MLWGLAILPEAKSSEDVPMLTRKRARDQLQSTEDNQVKFQRTFNNVIASDGENVQPDITQRKKSEAVDILIPNKFGVHVSRTYLVDQKRKRILWWTTNRQSKLGISGRYGRSIPVILRQGLLGPINHSKMAVGADLLSSKWVLTIRRRQTASNVIKRYL